MKYWNKPFVLEIYIRVTKNCIYTIKIGYGVTLIQKSYVKSPLGFLSFQTSANDTDDGNTGVSIPFGVSALLNICEIPSGSNICVSIPFGVSALLNLMMLLELYASCFNPLWGFCSSKRPANDPSLFFPPGFNPLWGFCSSKPMEIILLDMKYSVSIPFGVSALLNSISAIPVFMRAKLAICGEESFFRNISTENPLKTPLSPVFMRCAVKFNFSFIAFIYYNGNFL